MTDYSTSHVDDNRDNIISGSHFSHSHLRALNNNIPSQSLHPNGKMRLGKSNSSPATPVGELPPLVGVPHDKPRNHQTTPETSGIPAVCRGVLDSENPAVPGTPSPLMRRRLKYMVRQCSDSELLKNNRGLGRLKLAPASGTASPVPHPPDQSPRSLNSSESNSPRILRKPHTLNSRTGPGRISRSLEASPMVNRRVRSGVRRNSGGRDSSPSSRPTSPPSDNHRPRPFSFGSYSDVVQFVSSSNEPSTRSPGSPFVSRRTVGVRGGGPSPPSRADTPANDAISIHDSKKSHHISSSSGDRSEVQENEETSLVLEEHVDHEESMLPRRRLRRDSGSQHAQRNSTGPVLSDNNRNFSKKSQQVAAPTGTSDYPHYPHEDQVVDHLVDDDTGYPSNLYDIQERRESILSIEAVQEIARRFAKNGEKSSSESRSNATDDDDDEQDKSRKPERQPTPEYRKQPLSTDTRVSNWLKGIQDPTERAPTTLERILPDII